MARSSLRVEDRRIDSDAMQPLPCVSRAHAVRSLGGWRRLRASPTSETVSVLLPVLSGIEREVLIGRSFQRVPSNPGGEGTGSLGFRKGPGPDPWTNGAQEGWWTGNHGASGTDIAPADVEGRVEKEESGDRWFDPG